MAVSVRPNRFSRKRTSDVWSKTCELTKPPRVHGETTIVGTRIPRPYGPVGWFALPGKISLVIGTVDSPGVGGTRWSKKPPSSSYVTIRAILLHTFGLSARMSMTRETYHSP